MTDDEAAPGTGTAGDAAAAGTSDARGTAHGGTTAARPGAYRERRRRTDHLNVPLAATIAVGLAAGLLLADLVGAAVSRLNGLIITLIVSLFLSFAMEPAVQWLAQRGMRRGIGTLLVFLAALLLMLGFVAAMAPLIVGQIRNLAEAGPDVLRDLADQARNLPGDIGPPIADWLEKQRSELPSRVPDFAGRLATGAAGVGSTLAGVTIQFLTTLLVTFYLVADGPRLRRTLVGRMRPESQREFLQVWDLAIAKTGGYVYSRLLTAVASTVFHIVVFTIIGLPYSAALGVWVGIISSLIPVVGTYIAGA
ncbi:MAG: AI-2E family transporter, partial [Actinobacteria bacterium]|nr:AI-2E family transporter [Actinomycetota bacterium]